MNTADQKTEWLTELSNQIISADGHLERANSLIQAAASPEDVCALSLTSIATSLSILASVAVVQAAYPQGDNPWRVVPSLT